MIGKKFQKIAVSACFICSAATAQSAKMQIEQEPMHSAEKTACSIQLQNGREAFAFASFLYWQPIQENMNLGVISNSSEALDLVNGYEVDLNNRFKPGFKIGFGQKFFTDKWISSIAYTWFRAKEEASVSLEITDTTTNLLPSWQIPDFNSPQYHAGSETWHVNMDLLDWDLARNFDASERLCITPFTGLRAAWIRQKLTVDYVNENASYAFIWPSTSINNSTRSWALGPRAGIQAEWNIGNQFRLTSEGEFDILYTQYTISSKQTSETTVANQYYVNERNAGFLRTHAELNLGMAWGFYFKENRYHFDLLANYGFQAFFNQNMFRKFLDTQAVGVNNSTYGDLYLQGVTLTGKFDF